MDISEAIHNRRSIRKYKNQTLPEGTVETLIDAASHAPSAGNVQPWEFVVVKHQKNKKDLSEAAYGQKDLAEAAVVIVVCADLKRGSEIYGARGSSMYCFQDTAAAVQNVLLTACSLGLGSCWVGAFKEDEVKKIINAPEKTKPVAMIPVGYSDETPAARNRRPLAEIMHKETF
jgi:nitroreductase